MGSQALGSPTNFPASSGHMGVYGTGSDNGVGGYSPLGVGVNGQSDSGDGVFGKSDSGHGVLANSNSGNAIHGLSLGTGAGQALHNQWRRAPHEGVLAGHRHSPRRLRRGASQSGGGREVRGRARLLFAPGVVWPAAGEKGRVGAPSGVARVEDFASRGGSTR